MTDDNYCEEAVSEEERQAIILTLTNATFDNRYAEIAHVLAKALDRLRGETTRLIAFRDDGPSQAALDEYTPKLIATSPANILGVAVYKDRLIVTTRDGVFERGEDGKFHEIEFVPSSNRSQP